MATESSTDPQEFSLVLGGPVYQLLLRVGLIRPPLQRVGPRILVIAGMAWLPVAALTLLKGTFASGVHVPFLRDFEVHSRLLLMLPLLIAAEPVIHTRISAIMQQFLERRIITESTRPRFDAILASTTRLRDSIGIEVALLLFVFVVGRLIWTRTVSLHHDTWYATVTPDGLAYTPAGVWYAFVSVPIAQFIMLRWYFRLFLWTRTLWKVSRIELNLVPIHPDHACGLGFLGTVVFAMAPFLVAHTVLLAGSVANRILYDGQKLPDFKVEIIGVVLLLLLITLGPLCAFSPRLSRLRIDGLRSYGRLASDYVLAFNQKWIAERPTGEDSLLGTGDIQSLADLQNSFHIVETIQVVPFGKQVLIPLAAFIIVPLLPLALTMFSLNELLKRLLALVF